MANLEKIVAYLEAFDPAVADAMRLRLERAGNSLAAFPRRSRPAERGFRELAIVPPYEIRYRIDGYHLTIARIRHGRQRPIAR